MTFVFWHAQGGRVIVSAARDDCQSVIPSWSDELFLSTLCFIICVAVVVIIPTAVNVFFFLSRLRCLSFLSTRGGPRAESTISAAALCGFGCHMPVTVLPTRWREQVTSCVVDDLLRVLAGDRSGLQRCGDVASVPPHRVRRVKSGLGLPLFQTKKMKCQFYCRRRK